LASASRDKTVKLLDAKDLRTITTIVAGVTMEGAAILRFEDAEFIVAVGDCTSIRVWDLNGRQLISCDTYDGEVVTKLLFKSGCAFAIATQDHNFLQYKLRRSENGALELIFDGMQCGYHAEVTDVALISPSTVAVATNSNSVRVINFLNRESTLLRGHSDIVLCLCVLPNRDAIATGSKDSNIRLWNSATGKVLTVLTGHVEAITALCCCPSSNILFSGSTDLTWKAWDLRKFFKALDKGINDAPCRALYTVKAHEKDINGLAISPNGIMLASASQDKHVKMWAASDGKLLHTCSGHKRGIWCVAFSTVDRILASGSADSCIRIWNTDTGECIKSLQVDSSAFDLSAALVYPETFSQATSSVVRVAFMSAGVQVMSYALKPDFVIYRYLFGICMASPYFNESMLSIAVFVRYVGIFAALATIMCDCSIVTFGLSSAKLFASMILAFICSIHF
jgi:U3 small nucleolar RNA-associated protein 13